MGPAPGRDTRDLFPKKGAGISQVRLVDSYSWEGKLSQEVPEAGKMKLLQGTLRTSSMLRLELRKQVWGAMEARGNDR